MQWNHRGDSKEMNDCGPKGGLGLGVMFNGDYADNLDVV